MLYTYVYFILSLFKISVKLILLLSPKSFSKIIPSNNDSSPFKDELINQVDAVSPDQKVDNVGAFANMLHNAFEQVNNLKRTVNNEQQKQ